MVVPSASQSISIIGSIIVSIVVIPFITILISYSTKGSISRCKILLIHILIPGPSLIYLWFVRGLFLSIVIFMSLTNEVNLSIQSLFLSNVSIVSNVTPFLWWFWGKWLSLLEAFMNGWKIVQFIAYPVFL